ncbi:ubiquinol-cytochrome c reductase cytochrome c1 subunit [Nitrosomonas aestuarii]|uniref:Ubiquinol-cytochrome c reductase cytochrome c1 subunit n=1 Tax=Nitrosomonas aestuarii TaxID=52441 RepID=A0A1I4CLV3_9PROT|nr:cytochrome c1 [Nitrosomonas aestuarii]SFK81733.1 ubiquinol-cytochrome c reductase cytochrome c1 subunit [Nitrosomonas aestuarii]
MNKIKIFLLVLFMAPMSLFAAEPGMPLDRAPIDTTDNEALQRGAESFVNYCLTCHGASFMRYNRHRDIGLDSEAEVLDKLVLTDQKAGELMLSAMRKNEGEEWFGVAPPDLSVIARSRGADWLYTYLRAFYRDDTTVPGWNNLVFDRAAMPHVLYELQGEQKLVVQTVDGKEVKSLELAKPGLMTVSEYDQYVADLVNYLVYLGEPGANDRKRLGIMVMIFLFGMLGLTYALYREYWKDIH